MRTYTWRTVAVNAAVWAVVIVTAVVFWWALIWAVAS